jgi:hypothetical protein
VRYKYPTVIIKPREKVKMPSLDSISLLRLPFLGVKKNKPKHRHSTMKTAALIGDI